MKLQIARRRAAIAVLSIFAVMPSLQMPTVASLSSPATANATQLIQTNHEHELGSQQSNVVSPHIIGGQPSNPCQWPWLAAVTISTGELVCSASIISDEWLLTAAHCFKNMPQELEIFALLGVYNLTAQDEVQRIQIQSIIIHEDYDSEKHGYNDIALLRLSSPAKLSHCVQPAKLATPEISPEATECAIIGWGFTEPYGKMSDVVMQKSVDVISNDRCQRIWGSSVLARATIYPENVCIDSPDGSTACFGDSGSPLQCNTRLGWVVIGLSSWGSSACTTYPAVYMREAMFNTWIRQQTGIPKLSQGDLTLAPSPHTLDGPITIKTLMPANLPTSIFQ